MRKTLLLLLLNLLLSTTFGLSRVSAESRELRDANQKLTCGDRYNAMVSKAKVSLVKGDRAEAIRSLAAAQVQLHRCERLEDQDSMTAARVALNLP